ncbi:MAG: glycosyltransferase family 2 protein [Candidatus Bipolaricaulota bacterium]
MDILPCVTIVIPCRNEEKFIGRCLDSIVANDYPQDKLEVFVLDGRSEDSTRQILQSYEDAHEYITVLDNPKQTTPYAFNIGIGKATGDVIVLMGAHSTYRADYISNSVACLRKHEADVVGGIVKILPRDETRLGKAIAQAMSHPFCTGPAYYKTGVDEPRWVDTVFGGCYRKDVFERIGLFNEALARGQDMEFNARLRKAGGRILLVPSTISYYYPRSSFMSFCRHALRNGVWAIYPLKFTNHIPVSGRHFVPLLFVVSLVTTGALSFLSCWSLWLFGLVLGSYSILNLYFSLRLAIQEREISYLVTLPIVFSVFHFGYGLGSIWGAMKLLLPVEKRGKHA